MDIQNYISKGQERVEQALQGCLLAQGNSSALHAAMSYAVLNGGKRLRPLLAYASAETLGADPHCADIPACAVELIHAYSLIHDDLPAMDNDELRRGKPTCHIKFGEAGAILAGDALQSLAFEILADSPLLSADSALRLKMLVILSKAAGRQGMVAGQSIDIEAAGELINETELANMHSLKTGALIVASVQLGALSTGIAEDEHLQKLEQYARALGLAFQIQDDILDVESDTLTLGKQQGQDQIRDKPTYPSILGLDGARQQAKALCDQGIAALDIFGSEARPLIELARYIVQRRH